MELLHRKHDIQQLRGTQFTVTVNNQLVGVAEGETVISVLSALGLRAFSTNDHCNTGGGYCWMGICHNCLVKIDGRYKRRACQTVVKPGMTIETNANRIGDGGLS